MNLNRVYHIYDAIKDRLPKTYPRPKLAFFEDEHCMLTNNHIKPKKDESVFAVVSPETYTISLPLKMTFEYTKKSDGIDYTNTVPINKLADENIAHTILHEIGHLYAGERYGYDSKQYDDERYCDRFADRWVRILVEENLLC